MKKLDILKSALIIAVLALTGITILLLRRHDHRPATIVVEVPMVTNSDHGQSILTTQASGAVVVRDRGASFMMAPVTSKPPVVVPEDMVRGAVQK